MASMKRTGLISMLYSLIFHQLDFAGLLSGDMEIFFVELAIFVFVFISYKYPLAVFKEQKILPRISPFHVGNPHLLQQAVIIVIDSKGSVF